MSHMEQGESAWDTNYETNRDQPLGEDLMLLMSPFMFGCVLVCYNASYYIKGSVNLLS